MSDLDDYVASLTEKGEPIVQLDSQGERRSAAFSWVEGDDAMIIRLTLSDDGLHAEVSAYQYGVRQQLEVVDVLKTVMIYSQRSGGA